MKRAAHPASWRNDARNLYKRCLPGWCQKNAALQNHTDMVIKFSQNAARMALINYNVWRADKVTKEKVRSAK
jgi:hypothetical protein